MSQTLGSRILLGIGVLLATIATMVASQTTHFGWFLVWHNVLYGLSAGLLFLPPLIQTHKFFPKFKLISNSIILTGTGLGAVLFGANNIECIENDRETDVLPLAELKEIIDDQFAGCYLKMGFYVLIIGVAGVLLMFPMIIRNQERAREERELSMEERSGNFCRNQWQSFRSRVFWVIGFVIFLATCGNYYIIMNYRNLLEAQYRSKAFLYWILISGAIANGLPRYHLS